VKKRFSLVVFVLLIVMMVTACGSQPAAPAPAPAPAAKPAEKPADGKIGGTLNILVMPGYEEAKIIKPFEDKYGVKVNAKIYPSSDEMFAILSASKPGEWDVTTPDTPWIEKMQKAGMIKPLDPKDYPAIQNFYDQFKKFSQCYVGEQMYGIVSRWGYYGIVYNSKFVSKADVESIKVMWNAKYKKKIVLFDWYLPNMGMIGRYLGFNQPYDVNAADLKKIEASLQTLKPQIGAIAATNSDTIQALANGSMWLSFGGEWLQVLLKEQGHPIELSLPKEGGVSWTECLAIMKDSKNPEAAKAFVQYMISPEVQAKIAWADAFHATVPNTGAGKLLTKDQAAMLHMDDANLMADMLKRIATRKVPVDEKAWQSIWEKFKSK
jgi:spermidine/putrescine transport system substrate-binding protein